MASDLDCFADARKAGHDDINMDLIAGLPGDTVEGFEKSLSTAISLSPENITVHTLTLKRASNLVIGSAAADYGDVAAMLEKCNALSEAGYRPYYLYRQKNMSGNFENTGYARPGKYGLYNILIMEEKQTIVALGAGSITKRVFPDGRIERCDNVKDVGLYIEKIDEMIKRKRELFT